MATSESFGELFVTSRSRTPSLIHVASQHEMVFSQLPDLIQEAAVSTEFSSQKLRISRVQSSQIMERDYLTQPMFFVSCITDSGIDMPDLDVTDENFLGKYGSDLTANFADIRASGAKAFFQKQNISNESLYSLSACATGYIWVNVTPLYLAIDAGEFSDFEVQIGTFALKTRTITTREIPFRYKQSTHSSPQDGHLSLLFSTVLAKYLRLRIMGQQYEYAAETAIKESLEGLCAFNVVDPHRFEDFECLLRKVCTNAPMPPTSNVSLISRSMITKRWECWRNKSVLRRRYFLPQRVLRCLQRSPHDSIDLLSGRFNALSPEKSRLPLLSRLVSR